jgi:N-acetylmuramoyl-L-alanine amidase
LRTTLPARWLASPNHDERRPNFVILHHTSDDTAEPALRTLTDPRREVSAHYLVTRDGTIVQLVDERARAWHAGRSSWGGLTDLNSASLGIELDNNGEEPFPAAQIDALVALLRDLADRHRIPPANVLGHGDVAPGRKVDPSRHFPWQRLAAEGFGLWCEPPYPPAPASLDPLLGLQALGYDVADVEAAVSAFNRHFRQDDSPLLGQGDLALLQCLVERSRKRHPVGG